MKIHEMNDVHIEFGKMKYEVPECDVVVLAGDVGVGKSGIAWAQMKYDVPVIYVPGNHEFYNRILSDHIDDMRERAAGSNVSFLYNDAVIIGGVRFIGATLWTDFDLYGTQPLSMLHAGRVMSDYECIKTNLTETITPIDILVEHQKSIDFIMAELIKPHDGPTVLVTHHAPSELSVSSDYAHDQTNPAYASRLEHIMLSDDAPDVWFHGHIHSSSDYVIGNTRVVCNPRGYVGHELNQMFDPYKVIEV